MKSLRSFYLTPCCLLISSLALAGGHEANTPSGQIIFDAQCANCHDSLIGGFFSGAPALGDKDEWASLTPKGVDGLTQVTIAGIGKMAARGGCTECTDAEIRAAVEYMVEQID